MRGRRPRAGTLKGEAHGPQERQGPPAGAWETSWRLWGPGPGPPIRGAQTPGDLAPPAAGPACPRCLTQDIPPVQKGHFAHDGQPRLLQPVLRPAPGCLHELRHLGRGRGARQGCGAGLGTPTTTQGRWAGLHMWGAQSGSPLRVLAAEAKGGATPRPPGKGLTSWGASLGSPSQGKRISSPRFLPWGPVKDTVRHGKKPRGLES